MKRTLYITLFFFVCSLQAQESIEFTQQPDITMPVTEKTILYKLAENTVPIKVQQYGTRDNIVFISLHDDELTSVDAAKKVLLEHGGLLIKIENNAQRNIRFRLGRYFYKVDPNRIFAKEGIKESLEEFGKSSPKAIEEVEKLGKRITQLIPSEAEYIIALHNNTPGHFSVTEYTPGNKRAGDTKKVYINDEQDADDFFLTTDKSVYKKLAGKGYNTILQDNKDCTEDGSLSVYCGKKKMRYINCETEHGKTEQYYEMMKAVFSSLGPDPEK